MKRLEKKLRAIAQKLADKKIEPDRAVQNALQSVEDHITDKSYTSNQEKDRAVADVIVARLANLDFKIDGDGHLNIKGLIWGEGQAHSHESWLFGDRGLLTRSKSNAQARIEETVDGVHSGADAGWEAHGGKVQSISISSDNLYVSRDMAGGPRSNLVYNVFRKKLDLTRLSGGAYIAHKLNDTINGEENKYGLTPEQKTALTQDFNAALKHLADHVYGPSADVPVTLQGLSGTKHKKLWETIIAGHTW